MKKLIMLSVIGLMSTGMFANTAKTNVKATNITTKKAKKNTKFLVLYEFTCSDGSSWTLECDCSGAQVGRIGRILCS
jgi:hypothetical protein